MITLIIGMNAVFVMRSKMKTHTILSKKAMRTSTGKNVQYVNEKKTEKLILFPRNGTAMALITGMRVNVEQGKMKDNTILIGNTIVPNIGKYAAYVKRRRTKLCIVFLRSFLTQQKTN